MCWAPTATSLRRSAASFCCAAFEEAIHTHAYQYIVESLGLDEAEIFNATTRFPRSATRMRSDPLHRGDHGPPLPDRTPQTDQTLLKSLIVFACLMEGLFFYVGFTQILALGRQNKMTGAAEQYQYILRDESMHCNFGIDLINQLKLENPQLWTSAFKDEIKALFIQAVELEYQYAKTRCQECAGHERIDVQRLPALHRQPPRNADRPGCFVPQRGQPFPWMSEMIDLKKERNFFETRVIEYQSGGALSWD
ncbi:ribonucleotide-diphosphate reductase subunit beta [Comamonas sp. JC664]|uniref:ribonucleotide-diphosphate reductase subunit beta n=1 Tax=Comamonas sp. JC664 TaxID=2801917 RepID=UPI0036140B95